MSFTQVLESQSLSVQVLTQLCCELWTGKVSVPEAPSLSLSLNLFDRLFGYATPLPIDLGALYGLQTNLSHGMFVKAFSTSFLISWWSKQHLLENLSQRLRNRPITHPKKRSIRNLQHWHYLPDVNQRGNISSIPIPYTRCTPSHNADTEVPP